jgi:hypothetical protein
VLVLEELEEHVLADKFVGIVLYIKLSEPAGLVNV